MSETVYVLAVWDVRLRRWAALCSSPDRSKVQAVLHQLCGLVMVFADVVAVRPDTVEAIEAGLSMLPKVHPEAVFQTYFDLATYVSCDEPVPTVRH